MFSALPYRFLNQLPRGKPAGQTFIEIIIAVGLAGMVVTAILVLNAASSKVGTSSLKRAQASKIAVLAIESVRYQRDLLSYRELKTGCYRIADEANANAPLVASANCTIFETVNFAGNLFERKISIENEDPVTNSRKVTVTVRWQEATGQQVAGQNYKDVVLNTVLARW